MDSPFFFKLGLSFIVGSVWVTLATVAAEKYGSRIGGLIAGLPSTSVVALLFIGITQTPLVASDATTVMPIAQGLNGLYIIIFLLLAGRGLLPGLTGALLLWFSMAGILASTGIRDFSVSIAAWILLVSGCYLLVEKYMEIPSMGRINIHYTPAQIAIRAFFSGTVIAFAVFMGRFGGPIYGGIFATFPAVFTSTLVISHLTGGADFSRAVAKSLMVSGMVNVPLYAIAVRYLYVWLGLAFGTAAALGFSCATGYLTYLFIRTRLS